MIITDHLRILLLLAGFCCGFLATSAQPFIISTQSVVETGATADGHRVVNAWLDKEEPSPQDSACIPLISIAASQNNFCSGTSVTMNATVTNGGSNPKFNWKINGTSVVASSNASFVSTNFRDGDVVLCEYSCKTACGIDTTVASNAVVMHVTQEVTPYITVSNEDSLICEGELAVFKTTAFYGDWTPSYQWFVNGSSVGTNDPVFTTSTITNGAKIECQLTITSPACPNVTKTTRSQMTIYVYPLVHPAITITPSKTDICKGEEVTFTATANGGTAAALSWMINGVQTGPNAPSFASGTVKDGDKITCTLTIEQDSRCNTTLSAGSNEIVMKVRDFTEPEVSISAPVLDVCQGDPVAFTAAPKNTGVLVLYEWQVNGSAKGTNSPVFRYDGPTDGDEVRCLLTTNISGCPFFRTVTSDTETVIVRSMPVISFSPPDISIMSGESVQLQATVSGNVASFAWQPASVLLDAQTLTPTTIPLAQDTLLRLSVTDENGCEAAAEILINVLYKLYMPSAFTPNGDGKNDVFRIPPGASLFLKEFLIFNRWGNVVFRTTDITKGWNGLFKGSLSETGVYIYLIKGSVLDRTVTIKGTVMLIR